MGFPSLMLLFLGAMVFLSTSHGHEEPKTGSSSSGTIPVAEALTQRHCTANTDCQDKEYCYGKGSVKRCLSCFNCNIVQRKPRMKLYDGEDVCAKHHTDCGECNPGYTEKGGVCDIDSSLPIVPKISPLSFGTAEDPGSRYKEEELVVDEASSIGLIAGVIAVGIIVIASAIGGAAKYMDIKKGTQVRSERDEERAGLYNGSFTDSPTAPPQEEYRTQPAYNQRGLVKQLSEEQPNFQRFECRNTRALPFDLGNGPSEVFVNQGNFPLQPIVAYAQGPAMGGVGHLQGLQLDDEVPQELPHGDDDDNDDEHGDDDYPDGAAANRQDQNRIEPQMQMFSGNNEPAQPSDDSTSAAPPQGSVQAPINPNQPFGFNFFAGDPIVGQIRAGAFMFMNFEMPFGANQPAPPTVPSAPVSPRQIDATHIDLANLPGPFAVSRTSLDSGTGTSSAPSRSRSASGPDFSRYGTDFLEESMYEEPNPSVPHAPRDVPEVPDFEDMEE